MSWKPPSHIEKTHLLLVEGRDEEMFFDALIRNLKLDNNIQIIQGGKTSFRDRLQLLKEGMSGFEDVVSIGIVRDADDSAESAFQSICDALDALELPTPDDLLSATPESPHISILIMPPGNEGTNRMLEDLCLASAQGDLALDCVEQYFDCLGEQGITLDDNKIAKARVHAFLASRPEPDKRLGEAAQASYWNWNSPVFGIVKNFLKQIATIAD